jgi:hypothetical protein
MGTPNPTPRRHRRPPPEATDRSPLESWVPFGNTPACLAYACSLIGLIPAVGLAFGPLAVLFGWFGLRKVRRNPNLRGEGHSLVMGIGLGSLEIVVNALGLALIWYGWKSIG